MNIKSMLENGQMEGYSKQVDIMMGLLNGGSYDASDAFSGIPAIAGTAVGVSLLLRFTPKLVKFFKTYKAPGYSTWSHIYNPKISQGKIKGFHHAPMGNTPPKIEILGKFNQKHGFYEADLYMDPHFGASSRIGPKLKEGATMFPDEWSPQKVREVINKGYIKALLRGRGNNIQIPLNDILGRGHDGISIQYYMNKANGQPHVHPVIH